MRPAMFGEYVMGVGIYSVNLSPLQRLFGGVKQIETLHPKGTTKFPMRIAGNVAGYFLLF